MVFRPEVIPFIVAALIIGLLTAVILRIIRRRGAVAGWAGFLTAAILGCYLLYFFRDPERSAPADPNAIVAGADGKVMRVAEVYEGEFLKTNAVRISIFLNLFDVHVNRAPVAGKVSYLGYFPGKRYFTFQEKSSDLNQHSSILIESEHTRCLVNQIVGPVARRVVYWLKLDQQVQKGERIGMMKFGSRLDMYFPKDDIVVTAKVGDKVSAGRTIVATLKEGTNE